MRSPAYSQTPEDSSAPPRGGEAPARPAARAAWTRAHAAAIAFALALAIGVRLLPWSQVFTPLGVRFGPDGDAYYHALRARVLAQEHRVLWRDPGLSFPVGADVPWPPLFDLLVAAPAWLLGGAVPSNATVERVAAVLPVVLAALGVLVAILLGREVLGRRGAVVAGLLLAVAPVHVAYTGVGRPDHHVLEVLLLTALLALYAAALRRPSRSRWWWALLFAALLTASFWSWVGSTLYVVLLGALVFAAHVFAGRDAGVSAVRVVGRAAVIAGLLTGATVALFGPPGALATVSLGGLSALPVLASGALAAWCGALFVASRRRPGAGPGRRATEGLLASVAVAAVALMAVPPLRAAVGHGLRAAGHSGEWGFILETRSLLGGTRGLGEAASAVFTNFGMLPLLAVAGIAELARWWRDPARRPVAVFVATLGLVFVALAAHMSRFGYYAAVPLSIYGAMGLAAIARGGSRSGGRAGAASALVAALVGMASTLPGIRAATVPSARLEGVVRAVAPLASGMLPADGALLVRWDAGHHARYFSGRPVVASPFGADIGREAMADAAAFFLAEDPAAALGILARRGVRWVVVDDPASAALEAFAFAGGSSPPVTRAHDPVRGDYIHCEPSFDRLVAARLFYEAGSATPTNPSPLGGYRLVAEVGTRGRPITRLFEVVKGAEVRVRGARPSGTVAATVTVATPIEQFTWQAAALADAAGEAVLRLPLVTGSNGATVAGSYLATDGSKRAVFPVTEAQVRGGEVLTVDLTN